MADATTPAAIPKEAEIIEKKTGGLMSAIIGYVLTALISLIIGAGGMMIRDGSLPPKTVIQNYKTDQQVQTKSTSIQDNDQSQSTIILQGTGATNFKFVVVKDLGRTNRTYYFSTKTNSSSKTNFK